MQSWISINPTEIQKQKSTEVMGINVNVFLPPSHVPNAVRGYFNESHHTFIVEFKYIGDQESLKDVLSEDGVIKLYVGRSSGRIFKIVVDMKTAKVREVQVKIGRALDINNDINPTNRSAASSVLNLTKDQLFSELRA